MARSPEMKNQRRNESGFKIGYGARLDDATNELGSANDEIDILEKRLS